MEMINHMVTCFYIRLLVVWWLLMPSDDTVLSVSGIKRFFVLCVNRELIHEKICHEHARSKEHQACWFLAGFGHEPVMQRGNSVWYKSPFRTEKEASFKVDLHKELWYDFGLGRGGDIITLAKEIYRTQDISHVLRCIEDKRTVLKPVTVSCPLKSVSRLSGLENHSSCQPDTAYLSGGKVHWYGNGPKSMQGGSF